MRKKIRLTSKREKWLAQRKSATIKGANLRPPVTIGARYGDTLARHMKRMADEAWRELHELFTRPEFAADFTVDASIASQARILTNALTRKFEKVFNDLSDNLAPQVVREVDRSAATGLTGSLKELSGGFTLKADFVTEGLSDKITASVAANVDLIRRIPQRFFSDITGAVMRSITSGQGLKELQPYFIKKYEGDVRHARLVALDQTRKAYTTINAERMQSAGVRKFEWVHSGGSQHPREYHKKVLNGKIFSIDDPPIIDPKTGERGLPGHAPFCRCTMRPVIDFDD